MDVSVAAEQGTVRSKGKASRQSTALRDQAKPMTNLSQRARPKGEASSLEGPDQAIPGTPLYNMQVTEQVEEMPAKANWPYLMGKTKGKADRQLGT